MRLTAIIFALSAALWSADGLIEQYEAANSQVKKAEAAVQFWESRIANAGGVGERLKAQVELEKAIKKRDKAKNGVDDVTSQMQPGDALWERLHKFDPMKVPEMGTAGPVTLPVHQQDHTAPAPLQGAPPADISYTGPRRRRLPDAEPGAAGARWKSRPIAAPPSAHPVSGRVEAPPRPGTAGGGPMDLPPGPISVGPRDYLGEPVRWTFPQLTHHPQRPRREEAAAPDPLSEVRRQTAAGNWAGALRGVESLLASFADEPRLLFLKADLLNRLRRFAEAEAAALQAEQMGLDVVEVHEALGWARLHLGKYKLALASAQRALQRDPDSVLGHIIQASAYEQLGEPQAALSAAKRAAAIKPRLAAAAVRRMQSGGRLFAPSAGGLQLAAAPPPGPPAPLLLAAAVAALAVAGWALFAKFR